MENRLIEVLKEQEKALTRLLTLLDEQHKNIIKKDVFALEEIVERIQLCNKDVAQFEVERRKVLGSNSITEMINSSKNQELIDVYANVRNVLHQLVLQKDTNDLLIKQGISFTNKILSIINPNRGLNTYNSYGNLRR